jgi:hypothetical protein
MRVLFYGDACEKPTTEARRHGERTRNLPLINADQMLNGSEDSPSISALLAIQRFDNLFLINVITVGQW